MADLTPEDRTRIYQEEKAREAARQQIKGKNSLQGCGVALLIIAVIAIYSSVQGGGHPSPDTPTDNSSVPAVSAPVTPAAPERPDLEVLSQKPGRGEFDNVFITGKVRNNSDRKIGYAQITFNLYDKSGNQIGTAMDNIANLDAHGTWVYKASVIEDKGLDHYKLADVTGY